MLCHWASIVGLIATAAYPVWDRVLKDSNCTHETDCDFRASLPMNVERKGVALIQPRASRIGAQGSQRRARALWIAATMVCVFQANANATRASKASIVLSATHLIGSAPSPPAQLGARFN
jgi:hypothetical protein